MKTILRLVAYEFALIRILFFRVIFERLTNTLTAAAAGFGAVYASSYFGQGAYNMSAFPDPASRAQSMILFAFLYAETIMANWQYTTNKTGRMELIFNSTQPPLRIIFVKCFASASVTLVSMIALYVLPLTWTGHLDAFNLAFWLTALATLAVCTSIMTFNAVFEFQFKQVKALTSMLNLVMPYLAMVYAKSLPESYGLLPYFSSAKFLSKGTSFAWADVLTLYGSSAATALFFLAFAQFFVWRIKKNASVYLE